MTDQVNHEQTEGREKNVFYLDPTQIKVPENLPRYRKDVKKVKELLESINRVGQIEPVLLSGDMELVAGGRRLAACLLGNRKIKCIFIDNLSDLQKREIELEENVQREDLSPADKADAIADLHRLKQEIHGVPTGGKKDSGWRVVDTAEAIGKSKGSVIDSINISEALKDFPELRELKTAKAIKKAIRGANHVAEVASRTAEWEEAIVNTPNIITNHMDAVDDMKSIYDDSVDILLTDPKYGISIDEIASSLAGTTGGLNATGTKYNDSPEDAIRLYRELAIESFRFTKDTAHGFVFVAPEFFEFIRGLFKEAGWGVYVKPMIWIKRETGQCNVPTHWPASCYEMIMYCRKPTARLVVQGMPDWIEENPVLDSVRLYPTEKPVPLLRKLLVRVSYPGYTMYDPFMGSGATLEAGLDQKLIVRGCDKSSDAYNIANNRLVKYMERQKD